MIITTNYYQQPNIAYRLQEFMSGFKVYFLLAALSSFFSTTTLAQSSNCNYKVSLVSKVYSGGNTIFTWSVVNPKPGNGIDEGTSQDLSHWGISLNACVKPSDIISGAYSYNNSSWQTFTPKYESDKSQECLTTPVIKFDAGTRGSQPTYYKLTLTGTYGVGTLSGYFKSGTNTGCCKMTFEGIGIDCIECKPPTVKSISICGPKSVTLNASGCTDGTILWYASSTGGEPIAKGSSYTVTVSKTTTFYVTCKIGSCESTRTPVTVKVTGASTCSIDGNTTICKGTYGSFTAHGGSKYSWTGPEGFTSNEQTISGLKVPGTYTVTVTNDAGCTSTCSVNLIIKELVCSISGNGSICKGQTTSFSVTGGTSYYWTGPNGFTSTSATITDLKVAGTYTVTVKDASGCTSTCSKKLEVKPAPTCSITGKAAICPGESTTFTATGGVSYKWVGPNGFTASEATITNIKVAGIYTVTVSNEAGCTSTCSVKLVVKAPSCKITGNLYTCDGNPTSLTASGGVKYSWTGPNGFTANTATISNLTIAGTYTVTVTNEAGCASTCSKTIKVPVCSIKGTTAICDGNATTLKASSGGSAYKWTGPDGFSATTAEISVSKSGLYTVTITYPGGCTTTCSKTVKVGTLPVCNITGNDVICKGQTTSFTASGGTSYSWTGPNGFTATTATISGLTVPGDYIVTVKNSTGCTSTCKKTLTVSSTITCAISGNDKICVGQSTSFTASGGTSYSWTGPNGFTATTATISNLTVAGTYTVTVKNAEGCTSTCSKTLTIIPAPPCTITGDNKICEGEKATFTASGGTSYYWTGPNGFTATTATISDLTVAGTYTVTVKNENGCTVTASVTLIISPAPKCYISGDNTICKGESTSFTATGGTSYSWTGPNGFTATTATISNIKTAGTYTVTVKNAEGCTSTCSIKLIVEDCAVTLCTYTQGAYGNAGGMHCDGKGNQYTTYQTIVKSINALGGTLRIGTASGKSVTITTAEANKVIEYLPGGGESYAFNHSGVISISDDAFRNKYTKAVGNGYKINNTLLAQTITLGLNLGFNSGLSGFELKGGMYLITADVASCGSTSAKSCSNGETYNNNWLDATLINALTNKTVGGLFELANRALAGEQLPAGVTLSMISDAVDIINNAFDECKVFVGYSKTKQSCSSSTGSYRLQKSSVSEGKAENLSVTASPNPYYDKIRFVINSDVSGYGSLELYNTAGAKLKTVYQGYIQSGKGQVFEYSVRGTERINLFYILRVGDKQVTGKLFSAK